jgi:anti-sigma regulatory factor (Ser/Thr protein kinase)
MGDRRDAQAQSGLNGMTLRVGLPATRDAPTWAREWVSEALGDISSNRIEAARLLVSELVANSVRHAKLGPQDRVALSLEISDRCVKVEVADPGAGLEPVSSTEPNVEGGYGLFLLDQMADRWGVRFEGVTTVWFELDGA